MFEMFQQLPNICQGILFVMAGMIMLLYALGIIEKGITGIIIVVAVCCIVMGCIKIGLYQKIVRLFGKHHELIQKKE